MRSVTFPCSLKVPKSADTDLRGASGEADAPAAVLGGDRTGHA